MSLLAALLLASGPATPIYTDALAPGWASWSWNGDYDFASAELAEGAAAIACHPNGWGALSLHSDAPFGLDAGHTGLSFLFAGAGDAVWLVLEADGEGVQSERLLVSTLAEVSPEVLAPVTLDLSTLGPHAWTRVDFMDATGAGARFVVDQLALLSGAVELGFTAAEPVAPQRVMVLGEGEPADLQVTLDGVPVRVMGTLPAGDPARVYLDLAAPLGPGLLSVCSPERCFTSTLVAAEARLGEAPTHDISPDIYGIAAPAAIGATVSELGATVVRWGGNATSLYDPVGHFTNAGVDWFFENRDGGDAVAWLGEVSAAGARTAFTVPALDRVARDDRACAFPPSVYGPQHAVDPYGRDCGDGLDPAGNPLRGNDPNLHTRPWDEAQAAAWMATVPVPPTYAFVGNELDIAATTHRDVHPDPSTYDELRDRFLTFGSAIKAAWPGTRLAGPSSCCWWYYWNSAAGAGDKDAHGGEDFLPWFLDEIAAADARDGLRRLDVLDVHYYPDGVFNDADDAATRARRLRSTRSLWDPTYVDEGWIGADQWATQRQPSRNAVMLLPRLRALLDARSPGTGLGITEWNWGAERDLSGGLAVADVLGIFGREGLELGTYWTSPPSGSPVAAAFGLFRAFGRGSVPVEGFDPDRLGVFGARDAAGALTLVVVNKDPDAAQVLRLPGLWGAAEVQRFGGALRGRLVDEPAIAVAETVVVPAYSAALLRVASEPLPGADAGLNVDAWLPLPVDAATGPADVSAASPDRGPVPDLGGAPDGEAVADVPVMGDASILAEVAVPEADAVSPAGDAVAPPPGDVAWTDSVAPPAGDTGLADTAANDARSPADIVPTADTPLADTAADDARSPADLVATADAPPGDDAAHNAGLSRRSAGGCQVPGPGGARGLPPTLPWSAALLALALCTRRRPSRCAPRGCDRPTRPESRGRYPLR